MTERAGVSQLVDNKVPNVAQWAVIVALGGRHTLLALAEQSLGAQRCLEMNIRQKIESVADDAQCKYVGIIHRSDGKTFSDIHGDRQTRADF